MVEVKGDVIEEALVARGVKVRGEKDRIVRIHFEGTVTSIEGSNIEIFIEGASTAFVTITDETEIDGELLVGALVRVFGTIEPDLSVKAEKILVQQPLQLTPDELEMRFNQTRRVEAILREVVDVDVELTITSLDPAIAQPTVGDVVTDTVTLTIPAGKVSGAFQVVSGTTVGKTAIEVQMPESRGGFAAALEVEVEQGEERDEELEIRWTPRKLHLPTNKIRRVKLHLNQPAFDGLTAELSVEEGPEDLVEFPAMVSFEPGSRFVVVEIASGPEPGEVEIEARLPEAFGGDDADLEIEVKQRGRDDDDDDEIRREFELFPPTGAPFPGAEGEVEIRFERKDSNLEQRFELKVEDLGGNLQFQVMVGFESDDGSASLGTIITDEDGKAELRIRVESQSFPGLPDDKNVGNICEVSIVQTLMNEDSTEETVLEGAVCP